MWRWWWKLRSDWSIEDAGQTSKTKRASSIQADRILQSLAAKVTCGQKAPAITQDTAILGTRLAASCQHLSQIQEPQAPGGKLAGHADLRENWCMRENIAAADYTSPSCSSQVWRKSKEETGSGITFKFTLRLGTVRLHYVTEGLTARRAYSQGTK